MSPSSIASLTTPLITYLLAVPALPQSLPIPSLTHLSQRLPLFTHLLPAAADTPALLSQGKLATELGRTYFLANITTFAITGGMLARFGVAGARTWVKVVATLLTGVEEGWGRWAEGIVDDVDEIMDSGSHNGSDDDEDEIDEPIASIPVPAPSSKRKRQTRAPLPTNIASRLLLLGSTGHISTLADILISPSASSSVTTLMEFASFTLGLLNAFKGTSRWEAILDGLLEGRKGLALTRRLWREGVRGKWSTDKDSGGWQSFQISMFLTHHTPNRECQADKTQMRRCLDWCC